MKKIKVSNIIIYTLLTIWALITLYPFIWVIINSFKPSADILRNSLNIPFSNFTLQNYKNAFTGEYNILLAYFNSLFVSIFVVIIVLLIAGMGSFALARYEFKGKKIIYGFIIAAMMFPIFSIILPLSQFITKIGLFNSRFGVILPQVAGNVGFATVIITGFIQQLPIDIDESAYMDGATPIQVFGKLIFPMAKPAFATTAIFVFLWSYNDLFLQMNIIKDKEKMPISTILREISSKYGTDFGLMAASVALIIIPILIVYMILQKQIIEGLTAGAIKG